MIQELGDVVKVKLSRQVVLFGSIKIIYNTMKLLRYHKFTVSSININEIFDDVQDILKELEDNYEIDVNTTIGEYHKTSRNIGSSTLFDSIIIDLKDNNYNFFIFNEHILPTINRLRSFLSDDFDIDIELVLENEFYPLDEFIEEYGSEEFHEIGIIIY
jgi:hypothetical protein